MLCSRCGIRSMVNSDRSNHSTTSLKVTASPSSSPARGACRSERDVHRLPGARRQRADADHHPADRIGARRARIGTPARFLTVVGRKLSGRRVLDGGQTGTTWSADREYVFDEHVLRGPRALSTWPAVAYYAVPARVVPGAPARTTRPARRTSRTAGAYHALRGYLVRGHGSRPTRTGQSSALDLT